MKFVSSFLLTFAVLVGSVHAEVREWSDVSGRFKIQATFVELAGDSVKLKKAKDGSVISVPLEKISEKDRAYIRGLSEPKEPVQPDPPAEKSTNVIGQWKGDLVSLSVEGNGIGNLTISGARVKSAEFKGVLSNANQALSFVAVDTISKEEFPGSATFEDGKVTVKVTHNGEEITDTLVPSDLTKEIAIGDWEGEGVWLTVYEDGSCRLILTTKEGAALGLYRWKGELDVKKTFVNFLLVQSGHGEIHGMAKLKPNGQLFFGFDIDGKVSISQELKRKAPKGE